MPVALQILSVLATLCAAVVAALATVRAKKLEVESTARLKEADQAHAEAKSIWEDAKGLREELRAALALERERVAELLARVGELERQVESLRQIACETPACAQRQVPPAMPMPARAHRGNGELRA